MTYFARLIRFYGHYINFLIDRKQPERALEVAESSRARVLDERLESTPAHARESTPLPLRQYWPAPRTRSFSPTGWERSDRFFGP